MSRRSTRKTPVPDDNGLEEFKREMMERQKQQDEQLKLLTNLLQQQTRSKSPEEPTNRKRKRDNTDQERALLPSPKKSKDETSEEEEESEVEPLYQKDTKILDFYESWTMKEIFDEVGSPWKADQLKDYRKEIEIKGEGPHPLPKARPTEFAALKKSYNRDKYNKFVTIRDTMKHLEKIYNVITMSKGSWERVWLRTFLVTSLQMRDLNIKCKKLIMDAQGIKSHAATDHFFTTDDEVEEVKDAQQATIAAAAASKAIRDRGRGGGGGHHRQPTPFKKDKVGKRK